MSSHAVLSLDIGTHCGWCEVQDCVAVRSGTVHLPGPEGHPGNRFITFSNWLYQFKHVNEIFYEDVPRFESAKAARVYCGLLCIVQMFCLTQGIKMTAIKSNSVKKEFCGNGAAKKPVMCAVAHRMGWQGGHPSTDIDHDECDAIACAWVIFNRREEILSLEGLQHGFILETPKLKNRVRRQSQEIQGVLLPQ